MRYPIHIHTLVLCCLLAFFHQDASAEESWPQFRGPTGQGKAETTGVPYRWSESKNVVWKTPVVGRGWSSPVVMGNQIWITTAVEEDATAAEREERLKGNRMAMTLEVKSRITLRAVCIDRNSGKTIQDLKLRVVESPPPIHAMNSFASPTPVIEQGRVYCHFGTEGTWCLDPSNGKVLWHKRFLLKHNVGAGSSPVIAGDLLVLVCDGSDTQYVVAVDKRTGEEVWRKQRPPIDATDPEQRKAYSTPLLIEIEGVQQLIAPGPQWVVAYNPRTGDEIWRVDYDSGFSNVPRPVFGRGKVFICTGFMVPELWAIRPDGRGDITKSHVAWKEKRRIPARSSPLLVDDLLYVIHDSGVASCFQADTGKLVWRQRVGGKHSASPVIVDGKIFFFSHEGETTVIEPGREYQELAKNSLEGQIMATPAMVDGAILLRTDTHLYCLKEQADN